MVHEGIIEGRFVDLRSADIDDAEFTLNLRMDPEIAKWFPKFDSNLEKQKAWIKAQREKEGDYFFVIWDKHNNRVGTIGVYDIKGDTAEGGRIIVKETRLMQAVESKLLCNKFAFYTLGMNLITGFVYADNKRAIKFDQKFDMTFSEPEPDETGRMILRTEESKENFEKLLPKLEKIIYGEKNGKI